MNKKNLIDYVEENGIKTIYLSEGEEIIVGLHRGEKAYVSIYAERGILHIVDIDKNEVNIPYKERERLQAQKRYNDMIKQREKQKSKSK